MKGFALRSVRTRPVAMAVVALVALVAPVLLITSGSLLATAIVLPASPSTFTAPVIVAGPAGFDLPDQQHQVVAYPEGSVVAAEVADEVRAAEGVRRVHDYRGPDSTRVVALGVWPLAGTDTSALADRLKGALGADAQVLTGNQRGLAEDPAIRASRLPLLVLGAVTTGIMLAIIALVASAALGLTINERRPELRLLRLVGATPRQVRRMLVAETAIVAAAAATVGAVVGYPLSTRVLAGLADAGLLPPLLQIAAQWLTTPAAWLATILVLTVTARVVAGPAVRRAVDEHEPTLDRRPPSPVRRQVALIVGAVAAAMILATPFLGAEAGVSVGGPAVLVALVAVGLAAPLLVLRALGLIPGRPARWGVGPLGREEMSARAGRFGAVLTLVTLGVALAAGNISAAFTMADAGSPQVVSGTTVTDATPSQVAEAASTVDAPAVVSATATSAGWIEKPYDGTGSDPLPVVGVDHAATFVTTDTSAGSLNDLVGDTIAITGHDADTLDLSVGDEVGYRFGDGSAQPLRVVAILDAGRNARARVVPYDLLSAHVRAPAAAVLVNSPLLPDALTDRLRGAGVEAEVMEGPDTSGNPLESLGALIYLAVGLAALAFATLVAANSMVALTSSRRPELWAWRLVGATRRQLMGMLTIEATFVGTLGVVLGVVIGALSGTAIAVGLGRLPSVPPLPLCLLLLLPLVAVVMATLVPGRRATHRGL